MHKGASVYITGILKFDFQELVEMLPDVNFTFFESNLAIAQALMHTQPDAIMLHPKVHIPDGAALVNYIRTAPNTLHSIPVMAVFHEEDGLEEMSRKVGVNDCLHYPFQADQVQIKMEALFEKQATVTAINYVDLNYLHDVAGNDAEFIAEMVQTFLRKNVEYIEEMEGFFTTKNWEELGNIAHKAKSSYAMLGIYALQIVAALMEQLCHHQPDENLIAQCIKQIQDLSKHAATEFTS